MSMVSICLVISATLSIQPDRPQFFRYESFNMSCVVPGNSSGWEVMRNASEPLEPCNDWGRKNGSSCINRSLYRSDSGLYWCQSERGECSNSFNIQINTGVVILESPAGPVTEGESVTLRCSTKQRYAQKSSSNFTTKFFKDDKFIGKELEGTMILSSVTVSDQGYYHCKHSNEEDSLKNWLHVTVRAPKKPSPAPPAPPAVTNLVFTIVLFIIFNILFVVCIIIFCRWAKAQAKTKDSHRLHPDA